MKTKPTQNGIKSKLKVGAYLMNAWEFQCPRQVKILKSKLSCIFIFLFLLSYYVANFKPILNSFWGAAIFHVSPHFST